MIKNFFIVGLIILLGFMSGCDKKASDTKTSDTKPSPQSTVAKRSESNSEDIKVDLQKLNPILNHSNSEALSLRDKMIKAVQAKDENQIKTIVKEASSQLSQTNEQLLALTLKSKEVHNLTMKVIGGNVAAIRMTDISTKKNPTAEDKAELMELHKTSQSLQASVGKELDELNKKYGSQ